MIFGPSDAEFHLELEDTKKCIHQKLPKQRDSNGRSEQAALIIMKFSHFDRTQL